MPSARKLIERINELKLSPVARAVERRIEEFKSFPQRPEEDWFSELCFCILTANSSAELGIRIQREIGAEGFLRLPEEELALKLKSFGHRFYLRRARFIVEARRHRGIKGVVQSFLDPKACRDWIVKRVKGVGLKEASHFLRNVGYANLAIVDRHVLRLVQKYRLAGAVPRTLTRKAYLNVEGALERLAGKAGLSLAELDLYLWYMETGKVLK